MPRSVLRPLRLILALVLVLQSSLALAHCLRAAPAGAHHAFLVEVCSAEGTMVVDLGGGADHGTPHDTEHGGFCPGCHGLPQLALPPPAGLVLPFLPQASLPPLPAQAALPPGARAPPYHPTGPPAHT